MDNADLCLAYVEAKKTYFLMIPFFKFLFHSHVVVSVVFSKLVIEIEEKAHLIRNNVFVI